MSLLDLHFGEPLHPGRRARSRLKVRLPVRIVTLLGDRSGVLYDLSVSGARLLASREPPGIGEEAVLLWASHEAFGRVAWARARCFGLEFIDPLDPDTVLSTRALDDAARLPDERDLTREAARRWAHGQDRR